MIGLRTDALERRIAALEAENIRLRALAQALRNERNRLHDVMREGGQRC